MGCQFFFDLRDVMNVVEEGAGEICMVAGKRDCSRKEVAVRL